MAGVIAHQYAHLGETAAEYKAFQYLDHLRVVVHQWLEIGREDGYQTLAGSGHRCGRLAHFCKRGEYAQLVGGWHGQGNT